MSERTTAAERKLPPEITVDVIKKASAEQIRVWIRQYSARSVNNRIFERD